MSQLYRAAPICCPYCGNPSHGGLLNDPRCGTCIFEQDRQHWRAEAKAAGQEREALEQNRVDKDSK